MEAMDMENSHNPGGGSSETRGTSFDVFLNFRGMDTRHGFAANLYTSLHQAGIRVFSDEEELTEGERLDQLLIQAIRHSKIAIPILSKDYASSKWCLEELAQIVECHKTMGQIIMPVFLDVTPSVVRERSHHYGQAIAEHRRRRLDPDTLRKWEEGLILVGSIPGLESDGSRTTASIIEVLVAKVLRVLFVGIEHHVERFSARNSPSVIQPPDSISRVTAVESSSKVEVSKPAKTKHSFEGNEGRIVNIRSNDDELMKLNSLPDGGIGWRKIGKIFVSRNEIAKGSNGTIVFKGMYENRHVAVKRLVGAHCEFASNEIEMLVASDRHENIVRYYGVEYDEDFVYLALECCPCSLDDLIQVHSDSLNNHDPASLDYHKIKFDSVRGMMQDVNLRLADGYPSPLLLSLMRDVVSGLVHLHNMGIIHRDLKPRNVLITKKRLFRAQLPEFGALLCDMGISRCLPEEKSSLGYHATGCGTSGWRAPELLSHGGSQTRQMDLFSLGCVLFFCVTCGRHPFGEHIERDVNIAKSKMDLSLVEFIPEAHDLFSRLLIRDHKLRPKASEVLQHPFFWNSEMRLSFLGDVSDKVELDKKIDKVRVNREARHHTLRMKGKKAKEQREAAKELEQGIHLVKAPSVLQEEPSLTLPKIKVKVSHQESQQNRAMEE